MSARTPAEVSRLWFENVWDKREFQLVPELLAADGVGHLEGGQDIVGPKGFETFQAEFLQAIPDIRLTVVNLLAEGDDACVHWQAHGTHQGPGFGLKATGSPLAFRGVTWFRVKDGQIRRSLGLLEHGRPGQGHVRRRRGYRLNRAFCELIRDLKHLRALADLLKCESRPLRFLSKEANPHREFPTALANASGWSSMMK